jgi:hypothetical protein
MDDRRYARGRQSNLTLLAVAHIQAGDPEQASVVGVQAVEAAVGLRPPGRTTTYEIWQTVSARTLAFLRCKPSRIVYGRSSQMPRHLRGGGLFRVHCEALGDRLR